MEMEELITNPQEMIAATPGQLLSCVEHGRSAGYNRKGDHAWLLTHLDPDGVNVMMPIMVHKHADGMLVAPHMRCKILAKLLNREDAYEFVLDITMQDWNRLPKLVKSGAEIWEHENPIHAKGGFGKGG